VNETRPIAKALPGFGVPINNEKTMSWSRVEECGFAGIAWMQAGMRGHPRIVENGGQA